MEYTTQTKAVTGYDSILKLELSTSDCLILSQEIREATAREENPEYLKALRVLGEFLFNHAIGDRVFKIEKAMEQIA